MNKQITITLDSEWSDRARAQAKRWDEDVLQMLLAALLGCIETKESDDPDQLAALYKELDRQPERLGIKTLKRRN